MGRPPKAINTNNNKPTGAPKASNVNTKEMDEFCSDLVNSINKQMGEVGLYSISSDDSILQIKRFISTGSKQLDYIIANKPNGGLPEGRIVEIQGPPSIGKTHIAYEAIKRCQAQGGIGVFIDAENATSLDTLIGLGMKKTGLIYSDENIIEKIFSLIEGVVAKARTIKKDVPILIVWDSVAASSPKDESEADYEKNTIGLAARVFSKGFRKLTPVLKENNVTLLLLNQQRMKIGCVNPNTLVTFQVDNQLTVNGMIGDLIRGSSFKELEELQINQPVSTVDQNIMIETVNPNNGQRQFCKVLNVVRKSSVKEVVLQTYNNLTLSCSPNHKVYVRNIHSGKESYEEVCTFLGSTKNENFNIYTVNGWETFRVSETGNVIPIVDVEVKETHSYLSNGILSHNTIYGDPCLSPDSRITIRRRMK